MAGRFTLEDLNALAGHYGGKCLSKEYIEYLSSYEWMCKRGHKWDSNYYWIKMGHWCARCLKEEEKERQLEKYKLLAAKEGGKCLSAAYVNCNKKLKWKCAEGHIWETIPLRIKNWCPQCAREKIINKVLKEFEKSHGFILISSKYKNSNETLKWKCEKGHIIKAAYKYLQSDVGCPQCNREKRQARVKGYVEELDLIAKKRGGIMLSENYVNNYSKMDWQCKKGHQWSSTPSLIKRGSWCQKCDIDKKRSTIEQMQLLASRHQGKCLSALYVNRHTHLKWQCKKGHIWETSPSSIIQGAWCLECSGLKKLTIFDMQAIAASRGGKCLSKKFINARQKIEWQCENGHAWQAVASVVKAGSWCPYCYGTARKTIGDAKKLARRRKGKCLSSEYLNNREEMEWQCSQGHKWMASFHSVQSGGTWCPVCAVEKNPGTQNLISRWNRIKNRV